MKLIKKKKKKFSSENLNLCLRTRFQKNAVTISFFQKFSIFFRVKVQHYLTLIYVSLVYAKCLNSLIYLTFINIYFHRAFNPDHFVYLVQFKAFILYIQLQSHLKLLKQFRPGRKFILILVYLTFSLSVRNPSSLKISKKLHNFFKI